MGESNHKTNTLDLEHIQAILKRGVLSDELEFQRALIVDRELRLLAKDNPSLKRVQNDLRGLIRDYEERYWSDTDKISDPQIGESTQEIWQKAK